jgi:hypothetical protein
MDHLKMIASTAVIALALLAVAAMPASATVLTDGSGNQLKAGTLVTAENEVTLEMHPPYGSLTCQKFHMGGSTTNDGGTNVNVTIALESLSWSECNATYTPLLKGTLSIASTGGGNATLSSTGTEWTTVFLGFHCIYKTNNTKLGTLTGSSTTGGNATLDIEATIPRTGGSSGAFCGSTAQLTGSYKFTTPNPMNID